MFKLISSSNVPSDGSGDEGPGGRIRKQPTQLRHTVLSIIYLFILKTNKNTVKWISISSYLAHMFLKTFIYYNTFLNDLYSNLEKLLSSLIHVPRQNIRSYQMPFQ